MIKSLIKLGLLLVVGVLVYNFFLGTPAEKEQSRNVFNKGKEVVVSVGDLVKQEKEKFNAGKYDNALDKVENLFSGIRDKAKDFQDKDYLGRLERLDKKRKEMQDQLSEITIDENENFTTKEDEEKAKMLQLDMNKLMEKATSLMEDMEKAEE